MPTNINIPVTSDLIALGDPELKALAQKNHTIPAHIEELNARIDELESAIGQDTSDPIGRAYAIRAESSFDKDSDATVDHLHLKEKYL